MINKLIEKIFLGNNFTAGKGKKGNKRPEATYSQPIKATISQSIKTEATKAKGYT